jgi:hypothetical protein
MSGKGLVTKTIQEILARQKCPRGGTHTYERVVVTEPFRPKRGELVTTYHETRCTKCGDAVSKLRTFGIH